VVASHAGGMARSSTATGKEDGQSTRLATSCCEPRTIPEPGSAAPTSSSTSWLWNSSLAVTSYQMKDCTIATGFETTIELRIWNFGFALSPAGSG
jgi:hypothetical protein